MTRQLPTSTFLAAALLGALLVSPIHAQTAWTQRTSHATQPLRSVIWTGSQLVAVGDSGTILTSPDGIAWTKRNSGTPYDLMSVAWSGSLLVAVGYGMFSSQAFPPIIVTSPDGVTWTTRSTGPTTVGLNSVAWSGSKFFAVGNGSSACGISSPDGITWTFIPASSLPCNSRAVTWMGTMWVSAGNGQIHTSADGTSWTLRHTTGSSFDAVVWNGSRVVAVDRRSFAYSSTDGISWDSVKITTGSTVWGSLLWTGSQFLAGSSHEVFSSPDGLAWTYRTGQTDVDCTHCSNFPNGLAWTGSLLVGVGHHGGIYTSPQVTVSLAPRGPEPRPRHHEFQGRAVDALGRTVASPENPGPRIRLTP